MSDVNNQLLDAVKHCHGIFDQYVSHHLAKPDYDKAAANERHRAICADAIAAAEQAQQAEPVAADPAVAAIQFALETHSDGLHFLRLWNEGEFDLLRQEWPEAPEDIYIGADPLLEATAKPPAVAVDVPDGWHAAMSFARSALAEAIQIAPLDRLPRMAGAAMQQIDALLAAAPQKDPRQAFAEYHLGKPFTAAQKGGE